MVIDFHTHAFPNAVAERAIVLDEPRMLKIYDYAFEKGLIVLHHAGFDPAYPPPYKSSPKQFANIAKQMRGGVLVAAHVGVVEAASSKVQVQLQPFRKQFPFSVHKRIKLRYNKVPIQRLPF